MPRRPRSHLPDGAFHIVSRGVDRRRIFLDDLDHEHYLGLLTKAVERHRWMLHAACLMPNHVHLLITSTRARMSDGMRRLNGVYAAWFNFRYGRWGHLFGDRFWSGAVTDERQLAAAWAYVLSNPVRAGLCDRPSDWRWSKSPYGFPDEAPASDTDQPPGTRATYQPTSIG